MNQSAPPLPQLSGATCRNCGAVQAAGAPYCTRCGAPLRVAKAGSSVLKTVFSVALVWGALCLGALDGYLALIGVMGGDLSAAPDRAFLLLALGALVVAAACVWGAFRINRSK